MRPFIRLSLYLLLTLVESYMTDRCKLLGGFTTPIELVSSVMI